MKRHAALRKLSSDHHHALVLAKRAETASGDDAGIAEFWHEVQRSFREQLEPHFCEEEAHLLPALAQAGENALVERTLAEHAAMRRLIAAKPSTETLAAFAELLHAHVRFEERELFEAAQRRLSEAALAQLA